MDGSLRDPKWDRSVLAYGRIDDIVKIAGRPFYEGRPVIMRDTPISGGVYLGGNGREAIVVDVEKYDAVPKLFDRVVGLCRPDGFPIRKDRILRATAEAVLDAFPHRTELDVAKVLGKHACYEDDRRIRLDRFIEDGAGVCRHTALTTAAILEMFLKAGILRGHVSVDRNSTALGAHAWTRYTNAEGTVYILDIMQKYCGRLEDNPKRWPYLRPEDNESDIS